MNLLAQANQITQTQLGNISGEGLGPFGETPFSKLDGARALNNITTAVSSIIGVMTIAASMWFLFQLTVGGIAWMTSGGDKAQLTQARDRITNAFVGLIIVVAGWSILALAGQFFGWGDILVPSSVIEKLRIR